VSVRKIVAIFNPGRSWPAASGCDIAAIAAIDKRQLAEMFDRN